MIQFSLSDGGDKVDEAKIEAFEKEVCKDFPADFKGFLCKNNGGYPNMLLFSPEFEEIEPGTNKPFRQGSDVAEFLPLYTIRFEYNDIIDEGYIPPYYMPFARSSFDNLFLICLNPNSEYGSVFFANHDSFDKVKGRFTISKIASSFTEFVEALHTPNENK